MVMTVDTMQDLLQMERIIATRMFFDNKKTMKEADTVMWMAEQVARQRASVLEGLIVKNGGTVPADRTREFY